MSWQAVAEKDFRDAIRSRLMIAVAVIFVVFTGGGVALGSAFGIESGAVVGLILLFLLSGTAIFIPLVAIGISYQAIAGERQSGSLKLLLSLPNSRFDVFVGKILGRSGVVSVAVIAGFVTMLLATAITFDGDVQSQTEIILTFMLAALLLAIVFVSIAVSVSAFTESTFAAAIGSFGLFVLFQFGWSGIVLLLRYVVNDFEMPNLREEGPQWAQVLTDLNPLHSWQNATDWLLQRVAEGQAPPNSADAFYLEPWFGFVVLAGWIVVPLAVGYLRFESADL